MSMDHQCMRCGFGLCWVVLGCVGFGFGWVGLLVLGDLDYGLPGLQQLSSSKQQVQVHQLLSCLIGVATAGVGLGWGCGLLWVPGLLLAYHLCNGGYKSPLRIPPKNSI